MTKKLQGQYKGNVGALASNIYLNPKNFRRKKKGKILEIRPGRLNDDYGDLYEKVYGKVENGSSQSGAGNAGNDCVDENLTNRQKIIDEFRKNESRLIGEKTSIKEGFIYLVVSPSYPGWVKAGMTVDFEDRLSTYNQSSPLSDFVMKAVRWVPDRRVYEDCLLNELSKISNKVRGEWFLIDENLALRTFNS